MAKKMNPKVKKAWVAALRSGEYKQGKGDLRNEDNRFCCLGVLCNLHAQTNPKVAAKQAYVNSYMGSIGLPPLEVVRWARLPDEWGGDVDIRGKRADLAKHNDDGRTFAQIADAIESQL